MDIFENHKTAVLLQASKISPDVDKATTLVLPEDNSRNESFSSCIPENTPISIKSKKLSIRISPPQLYRALKIKSLLTELRKQDTYKIDKMNEEKTKEFSRKLEDISEKVSLMSIVSREELTARHLSLEQQKYQELMNLQVKSAKERLAEQVKIEELNAKREWERNEQLKREKQISEIVAELTQAHNDFLQQLQEICKKLEGCKNQEILKPEMAKIKSELFESLFNRCKTRDVNEDYLQQVKDALRSIRDINDSLDAKILDINKKLEEEEVERERIKMINRAKEKEKEKEDSSQVIQIKEEIEEEAPAPIEIQGLKTYLKYCELLNEVETQLQPLLTDPNCKKYLTKLRKAIGTPLNAISPESGRHLLDKYKSLYNLVSGTRSGDVSSCDHPLGILFCKNLLAEKFVLLGDVNVSSKPEAAYSLAAVIISIWSDFPDFGELVLGHFYKSCPYLVPVFLPHMKGQSSMDYYRLLGYHYSKTGEIEEQDKYLKRSAGFMRLFAALLISRPRNKKMNPLGGVSLGWNWLANILNSEPQPDICAVLILEMLEVLGHDLLQTYFVQFKKMLAYICREYFTKLEKITPANSQGPLSRLETFLQNAIKESSIAPPPSLLPPNFW